MELIPSLIYDGQTADLSSWQKTTECCCENKKVVEWISPDEKLAIRMSITEYPDFPVMEMVPELICRGSEDTKIIEKFKTLSVDFATEKTECILRAVHGARTIPTDFTARKYILAEDPVDNYQKFTCGEGRSSNIWMPWFGLDISALHGWEIAIGWTGAWLAEFTAGNCSVNVRIGMEDSQFYMKPGEVFRLPGILLFQRQNISVMDFHTVIRNFMIQYKSPRDSQGKVIKPKLPVTGSGGNRPTQFLIDTVKYFAERGYPFDTFWVDAGWYGPPHEPDSTTNCGDCWSKYVGNWHVNTLRHPNGLRPVADAARENGMKFLLWFEPERAAPGVPILSEHPEYYRTKDSYGYLLNFGNKGAADWIFGEVCRNIDEIGVDVYRQDFNMDPLVVWRLFDEENRKGVNEIKHIMGLYEYLDKLKKRYPDMLLENCSSGGRRMDYEMMSRTHSYCRSDYYISRFPPESMEHAYQILMGQNALMNTMAYVPFQSGETNPVSMFNDYEIFSIAGTGSVFTPADWNDKIPGENSFNAEEEAWLKARFKQIDRIRNILYGELYWLVPEKTNLMEDIWTAYQGWNQEINKGVAVFFRRKNNTEPVKTFMLKNIDADAQYEVEDITGNKKTVSGKDLACWTVQLEQPQSTSVLFYQKLA